MATFLTWKHACLALSLLALANSVGKGQQIQRPESINLLLTRTANGLPVLKRTQGSGEHDTVHTMLEDKAGHLWLATTGEGVYRYDGKGFTQYTQNDGLASNRVYAVLEDASGSIWFGTEKGISRYDGKTITSVPIVGVYGRKLFQLQTVADASVDKTVWSIMQDSSGTIWFGTSEGLFLYDGANFSRLIDSFSVTNSEGLKLKKIQCMRQDKSGIIWLGSGMGEVEGLMRYDGMSITSHEPSVDRWIRGILEDSRGVIWLTTRIKGVWRNNGTDFERLTKLDENGADLFQTSRALMEDHAGNIWLGGSEGKGYKGNGGICRYDGESFTNYSTKDGLGDYSIVCMLEDRAGNLWVGTRNTGLYKFDGTRFVQCSEEN